MSNLADLEVEDIQEIVHGTSHRDAAVRFALAIREFLAVTKNDGGAESDLIFMTGARIARSGVWAIVAPKILAANLRQTPADRVELMLEAADAAYKMKVLREIGELRAEIKRNPVNEAFALRASKVSKVQAGKGLLGHLAPSTTTPVWSVLPPPPGDVHYENLVDTELAPSGWPPVTGFYPLGATHKKGDGGLKDATSRTGTVDKRRSRNKVK